MLCTSLQLFCFVADKPTGRKALTNDYKISWFILELNLRLGSTEHADRVFLTTLKFSAIVYFGGKTNRI